MNQEEKQYTDEEIANDLKEPFDYGSPEYLKVVAKIKANREKYRREREVNQVLKYKMLKVGKDEY
jgi:hypothetical protein